MMGAHTPHMLRQKSGGLTLLTYPSLSGLDVKVKVYLQHCRQLLKAHDYPRYLLSLTLPAKQREMLWVLGAVNVEASRAVEMSEPATGAIRLKWWLEALEQPREHPVVEALQALGGDLSPLQQAIEAREADLAPNYSFANIKELDAYATATGAFWTLLAQGDEAQVKWLTQLGQCWALQGVLWSTGYQLSRGRCTIPREVTAAHGVDPLAAETEIEHELCHMVQTLARRVEETLKRIAPPEGALLTRAAPFIHWRATQMRANPMLALAANPPESRLKMWWKMIVP